MDVRGEMTEKQKQKFDELQVRIDGMAVQLMEARKLYIELEESFGEDLHNALELPFASEQRWLVERFSEDADERRNLMKFLNPRS